MAYKKPRRGKQSTRKSPNNNKKKQGSREAAMKSPAATDTAQKLTFIGTVKSESATGVGLSIDGNTINMEQDGDTWTGQRALNVGESVNIKFRVKGPDTAIWAVEVDIDCENGPVKLVTRKGTIGKPNGNGFDSTEKIKPDVCGS